MHGEARGPLLVLLGVTGVVLLIACANIANLLLIRAASRGTELAVRLSIGASRRHVVLQLLTESCLLGLLGGLGGLLMARWTLGLVVSLLPPDALDVVQTGLDWRALAFAAALSIGTGLLFVLFPAISSTRPDLVSALRAQSGLTSGARSAGLFRSTLGSGDPVAGQLARSLGDTVVVFSPTDFLEPNVSYVATLSNVADLAGNPLVGCTDTRFPGVRDVLVTVAKSS